MNIKQKLSKILNKKEIDELNQEIEKECVYKCEIIKIFMNYSIPKENGIRTIPNEDAINKCLIEILKLAEVKIHD
jgi:hypothetical protein